MTGDELREMRKAAGLTQAALAERLGVRQSAIYRWEQGQRGISEPMARLIGYMLTEGARDETD